MHHREPVSRRESAEENETAEAYRTAGVRAALRVADTCRELRPESRTLGPARRCERISTEPSQRLCRPPCGKAVPFRGLPLLLFLAAMPPWSAWRTPVDSIGADHRARSAERTPVYSLGADHLALVRVADASNSGL